VKGQHVEIARLIEAAMHNVEDGASTPEPVFSDWVSRKNNRSIQSSSAAKHQKILRYL
jgi:hypothetical protein